MILGNRELGPGSSVYIGADTLYGFSAGDQGLRILIFMGDGRVRIFQQRTTTSACDRRRADRGRVSASAGLARIRLTPGRRPAAIAPDRSGH